MTIDVSLYRQYLNYPVVLIGAGGIGSNLLPTLVKAGPKCLSIWDDDHVEPVNLAQQNFNQDEIGMPKCIALAHKAQQINPAISIIVHNKRVAVDDWLDGIVISGVDSMESRKAIFAAVRQSDQWPHQVSLYIDGRLSRKYHEICEFYCINPQDPWEVEAYYESLFDESLAPKEPRPDKLAAQTPQVLAGLITQSLSKWVHKERRPWKVTWDGSTMHAQAYWRKP